ncbi:MAG: 12,18-didecarboxysiroheme deacetylase, partial [Thermodesulfobacterium geofontis]
MISISKLYCGAVEALDHIRYGKTSLKDKRPVVVWNVTKACNLKCIHCYAKADNNPAPDELTTKEGFKLLEDLAQFGSPVILFSGGEPLIRSDILDLIYKAVSSGLRTVISTNGILIDEALAKELKKLGVSYVGISLDGWKEVHDRFRGVKGAFEKVISAVSACKKEGLKVGLRFTMSKLNAKEIPKIFELVEELEIPRVCFYHLVYSGRGSKLIDQDLSHEETRYWVDYIISKTKELHDKNLK